MYIHNYQIHNVLNVYRQRLSRDPGAESEHRPTAAGVDGAIQLPGGSPRQTIIDRVSSQIVDRLVGHKPGHRFGETLSRAYAGTAPPRSQSKEVHFTYSAIDENDRKLTNTLAIGQLSPMPGGTEPTAHTAVNGTDGAETAS